MRLRPPKIIETERLSLRPAVVEDAASIFEQYARDPDVTKYLIWKPHQSIQDTHEYIDRCISVWAEDVAFPYMLIRKEDARLIGAIEIQIDEHKAELGYVLAKSEWRKGYMSEATQALVDWALGQDDIYRVWAFCDVDNYGSARVLEKVGMQREGILRRWAIHPNVSKMPRDCYCYAAHK